MANGLLADGAVKQLIAIDKHLQSAIKILTPAPKDNSLVAPVDDKARERANTLLASMQGAKLVRVERVTEKFRMELGGESNAPEDVIDVDPVEDV